jgi:hypothetical protein
VHGQRWSAIASCAAWMNWAASSGTMAFP